jgi:hypothetical protein
MAFEKLYFVYSKTNKLICHIYLTRFSKLNQALCDNQVGQIIKGCSIINLLQIKQNWNHLPLFNHINMNG